MIRFQDNDRWQNIFGTILENSRWRLTDGVIDDYAERSFDYVIDYLSRRGSSIAAPLDPIGDVNLGLAKKVRRMALQDGAWEKPEILAEMADEFFPLPPVPYGHWRQVKKAVVV
jgi:hypothetical protein